MIRIVVLSLLTLSLSCGNTSPESAEMQPAESAPVASAPVPTATTPQTILTPQTDTTQRLHAAKAQPTPRLTRAARRAKRQAARSARAMNLTPSPAPSPATAAPLPIETALPIAITMPRPAEIYTPETTEIITSDSLTPRDRTYSPATNPFPDRKNRFLPMSRRMDREINRIRYVHKGEVMLGLTASYGTLDSEDSDLWLVLDNINLGAHVFTINPFLGYFFRDNMCLGGRFGYSEISGHLGSIALDLDDINLSLGDITLKNKNFSFGIFLRSYAGLDPKGHFGLFGELELSMSSGTSEFSYMSSGVLHQTFGDNTKVKISFNPGMAVYIFPNVCASISFGLGGFQYVKTTQKDAEGNLTGTRSYSNLRFRLNLAEIRIGMTVHLWNKKKALLK